MEKHITNLMISQENSEENFSISHLPLWIENHMSCKDWENLMKEESEKYEKEQAAKQAQIVININWDVVTGTLLGFAVGLAIALLK